MSSTIKGPEPFEARANKVPSIVYYVMAGLALIVPIFTLQIGIPLTWFLLIIAAIAAATIVYSTYEKKMSVSKYAKYIDSQVEIEKEKQSVESGKVFWAAQKPDLDTSAVKIIERSARDQAYRAIIDAFKEELRPDNDIEKQLHSMLVEKLENMRRGSIGT